MPAQDKLYDKEGLAGLVLNCSADSWHIMRFLQPLSGCYQLDPATLPLIYCTHHWYFFPLACNKFGYSLIGLEFDTLRDKWKRKKSPMLPSRGLQLWNKPLSPHTTPSTHCYHPVLCQICHHLTSCTCISQHFLSSLNDSSSCPWENHLGNREKLLKLQNRPSSEVFHFTWVAFVILHWPQSGSNKSQSYLPN